MSAGLAGGLGDQAVAGGAGGGGQSGGGLVAGPRQAAPVGAGGAGGGSGAGGPVGAVRVQIVIDGQRRQATAVRLRPLDGEVQESDRIAAAGQGESDRAGVIAPQPGGQAGLSPGDPIRVLPAQPGLRAGGRVAVAGARTGAQAKRVPSSVARVRWAAEAVAA